MSFVIFFDRNVLLYMLVICSKDGVGRLKIQVSGSMTITSYSPYYHFSLVTDRCLKILGDNGELWGNVSYKFQVDPSNFH